MSMPVTEFIRQEYAGRQVDFARAVGVNPQQVTKWVNGEFVITDDGYIIQPRIVKKLDIKKPE